MTLGEDMKKGVTEKSTVFIKSTDSVIRAGCCLGGFDLSCETDYLHLVLKNRDRRPNRSPNNQTNWTTAMQEK